MVVITTVGTADNPPVPRNRIGLEMYTVDPLSKLLKAPVVMAEELQAQASRVGEVSRPLVRHVGVIVDRLVHRRESGLVDRRIAALPNELLVRIFLELPLRDALRCRRVSRRFRVLVDRMHIPARVCYRECHIAGSSPLSDGAVVRYQKNIRAWLMCFNAEGGRTVEQLDGRLACRYFPEILFFSVVQTLGVERELFFRLEAEFRLSDTRPHGLSCVSKTVRFSPDGSRIALVSADGEVRIFARLYGMWQEQGLIRHNKWINEICFSPDGALIGSASADRTVKISAIENGCLREAAVLPHYGWVGNVRFGPDGTHVVTGTYNRVRLWRLVSGCWQELAVYYISYWLKSVSISPDGAFVIATATDKLLRIMRFVGGQLQEISAVHHCCDDVCFNADGTRMVTVPTKHSVCLWRLVGGEWNGWGMVRTISSVHSVRLSSDGTRMAVLLASNQIKVWSEVKGRIQEQAVLNSRGGVNSVDFSPDGGHLLVSSHDGVLTIWGIVGGYWRVKATVSHDCPVAFAAFSPCGTSVVSGCTGGTVKVWRITGQQ